MNQLTGLFSVLTTENLPASQRFFERFLGLRPVFVTDWYVQLAHPESAGLQLGLVVRGHPSIPDPNQQPTSACLLTFEVRTVDSLYRAMTEAGVETLGPPKDEAWGQRHYFALEPGGFVLDIVEPIAPSAEYGAAYNERGS